jgi:CubicO group peptidase (beta-lactamase class C family)
MAKGFDQKRLSAVASLADSYVERGKLAGVQVQVAHEGKVALRHTVGKASIEEDATLVDDAIFRIFSMSKPITSVALMQLHERGKVLLEHPVSKFIPEFADPQIWVSGNPAKHTTRPSAREMTVRDALCHTTGLTYGFFHSHPVDALYRADNLGELSQAPDFDLAEAMRRLANKPLLFEPGSSWNYSMSTDLCGALVEVISGQRLDDYFVEHIFGPLRMVDTGFAVPEADLGRLTSNYMAAPDGSNNLMRIGKPGRGSTERPAMLSGGGGLLSTTDDYQRFCDMLLAGGELDGQTVIGRKTLEYMTLNHLPGGRTLNECGQSTFSETAMEGVGFGLGFSVVQDPAAHGAISSVGQFSWGGAASTVFYVDPVERFTVVWMTQFIPSNTYPIRRQLQAMVAQALL